MPSTPSCMPSGDGWRKREASWREDPKREGFRLSFSRSLPSLCPSYRSMPPRRSARVADLVDRQTSALAPLPPPVVQRIFTLLPADARGRACCVSRGWRAVLADPSLWSCLVDTGLRENPAPLLLGAARRARGLLHRLHVSRYTSNWQAALLEVVTSNADSLRELSVGRISFSIPVPSLEALVRAAPNLQVVDAYPWCGPSNVPRLMRSEPPFAPLRLRGVSVSFGAPPALGGIDQVGPFVALLADATLQPTLRNLAISYADTQQPAVLDALVDQVLARRLQSLTFAGCSSPTAASLARLLRSDALVELRWKMGPETVALFDAAGAALVADALRDNTTLERLYLFQCGLFRDVPATVALLAGLVGHRSLKKLEILVAEEPLTDRAAIGTALAAIVAADAPALRGLELDSLELGDAGLAPILDALPQNHHLLVLDIGGNGMSEEFARNRLLPAIRANTSLYLLCFEGAAPLPAAGKAAKEAMAHVASLWDQQRQVLLRGYFDDLCP